MCLYTGKMPSFDDLTESRLFFTAVRSAGEAIVVTDGTGIVVYANPASEEVTGFPPRELVGRLDHLMDREKHDASFNRELREALDERGVWRGRIENTKKDGTPYQEDCTVSAVKGPGGEVVNYVTVRRDVTEVLRLESLAEAVNVADNIGYVFSGIRHEIGNPVNAIRMTMTMLQSRLEKMGQSGVDKYIQRCLDEISRVQYLLDNLKSFNLFENPSIKEVTLSGFMDKFASLVRPDIEARGVSLEVSVDPPDLKCLADPRALQQVLLNVVTNAAEACEGRDNAKVTLWSGRKWGHACIRVCDNGVGMGEEQLRSLFRPFMTTKPDGTGLGLVIARRMLMKMGGSIEFESAKDEGTTAAIWLLAP